MQIKVFKDFKAIKVSKVFKDLQIKVFKDFKAIKVFKVFRV